MSLWERADQLLNSLPEDLSWVISVIQEKGASNWLTAIPIAEHEFIFHESAILWCSGFLLWMASCQTLSQMHLQIRVHSRTCYELSSWRSRYSMTQWPSRVHSFLLFEVCRDVAIESKLQSLTGESLHYQSAFTINQPLPQMKLALTSWHSGFGAVGNTKDQGQI